MPLLGQEPQGNATRPSQMANAYLRLSLCGQKWSR
jgi:hypothetical protein